MIIGIGADIIQVERIARLLDQYPGFCHRVFTAAEIEYCNGKGNRTQSFAVRFAAKEAVMKALGTGWDGRINWTDIEIGKDANGRPCVAVYNATRELIDSLGVDRIHISLSHEKEFALAYVILERENS